MIISRAIAGLLFLIILLSFCVSSSAGTNEEIASLLLFVQQSGCTFIRNGNHYDALAAREHIEKNILIIKSG
jgi:hypothetical protein